MSSVQSNIQELESIKAEIKRNNERNAKLRGRVKVLERDIASFLKSKDQEGVKYKGKKFVVENKVTHKRKGKKQKEEETIKLLRDAGVYDAESMYSNLVTIQKGDRVQTTKIKVSKDNRDKNDF